MHNTSSKVILVVYLNKNLRKVKMITFVKYLLAVFQYVNGINGFWKEWPLGAKTYIKKIESKLMCLLFKLD